MQPQAHARMCASARTHTQTSVCTRAHIRTHMCKCMHRTHTHTHTHAHTHKRICTAHTHTHTHMHTHTGSRNEHKGHALSAFKPQELTSLAWALAKGQSCASSTPSESGWVQPQTEARAQAGAQGTGIPPQDDIEIFFKALSAHLQRRALESFKAQELSTILWSFAANSQSHTHTLDSHALVFEMGARELEARAFETPLQSLGIRVGAQRVGDVNTKVNFSGVAVRFKKKDLTLLAWSYSGLVSVASLSLTHTHVYTYRHTCSHTHIDAHRHAYTHTRAYTHNLSMSYLSISYEAY